ncbi:hypothetical protein HPQ64_10085 [Rhizobiales bacterium]|uniref:DUF6384 family protein n=1 Tax=Hongsoonwoonella zoysiae TaxID=2821844 RepID=UPI00156047ED|nr:DUF6384 family protein [Hongsoonwoonella zoysiae]NRG18037.1 hypothetical protein [Hongsoonwoonella zoysiae]
MPSTSKPAQPPLDDLMMAMDVVDTLRHDEALALKELTSDQRDEAMVKRLRDIYESQGIEVPDRILREGVEGLKENRFVYNPPASGFSRTLAMFYIRRNIWGRWLAIGFVVLVAAVLAYRFLVIVPAERAAEDLRVELTQTLPGELEATAGRIAELSREESAVEDAERLLFEGKRAAKAGEAEAARKALSDMKALEARLSSVYEIRIVSRPGMPTGVTRIPDVNLSTENYYLVVEAIGPDGNALEREVISEEDGARKRVRIWAQRVPRATFDAVRQDKEADGIVQENLLGRKERGRLDPDWVMAVESGAITQW